MISSQKAKKSAKSKLPQLQPSWQLDTPMSEYITCMEWLPNTCVHGQGSILVLGLANGEVVLVNSTNRKVLHREINAHQDGLLSLLIVELENERNYVICASQDGSLTLWKVQKKGDETFQSLELIKLDQYEMDGGQWIESMVWMQTSKKLAVASSNQVHTFSISKENKLILKRTNNTFNSTVSCLAYNQKTNSLAISSYGNIQLTDSSLYAKLNISIKGSFQMSSFSEDGKYCICGMLESMAIILNTESQQIVPLSLPKKPSIIKWLYGSSQTCAISSNSSVVVLKSIPLVEMYMSEMDEEEMDDEVREILSDNEFGFMHPGSVSSMEFVPAQYRKPWIVSACSKGLVRVTDYESGRIVAFLPMGDDKGVSCMKFESDFNKCTIPLLIVGYSDGSLCEIPLNFK